jgi:processive 1,2-diacylglycerol beta-glucosyltransferase
VVLAGRSEGVKRRCATLARLPAGRRLRVFGWISDVREWMHAADLLASQKLGHTFDEAIATRLPIVSLEPPPGSERIQYGLLDAWGVGLAVRTLDEMSAAVRRLLADPVALEAFGTAAARRPAAGAAERLAEWILDKTASGEAGSVRDRAGLDRAGLSRSIGEPV